MEYAQEGLQTKPSAGPVRGTFSTQSIRSLGRVRGGGVCLCDGGRGGHDEPSSSSLDHEWVPPAGAHSGCWDEGRDHAPHAQVRQSHHDHLTMLFGICQGIARVFVRYLFWSLVRMASTICRIVTSVGELIGSYFLPEARPSVM